jgi:geranylgeranylglycerol-phosphate geranylgeranyltransferase
MNTRINKHNVFYQNQIYELIELPRKPYRNELVIFLVGSIRDYLSLIRIGNSIVIGVAAITGYIVSTHTYLDLDLIMLKLFFSAFFIGVFGNIINDIYDLEIDKINKPWRPLPSGRISVLSAWILGLASCILGILLALIINIYLFIIAVIASITLYYYSKYLKRRGLAGNLTIAFLSFLVILYGGMVSPSNIVYSLVPGIYAFIIILGREIYKGIEDVEGDEIHGVKTIAVRLGIWRAYIIGSLVLMILVIISPLPYIYMGLNIYYLSTAIIGVDIPIIYSIILMSKNPVKYAWRSTRILKIPLLLGLIAFILGVLC